MKKIIALILMAVTLSANVFAEEDMGVIMKYFDNVRRYIQSEYKFEVTDEELYKNALNEILKNNPELLEQALSGMTDSLDEHSYYMTAEEFSTWINDLEGSFVGIGVTIEERNGQITVIAPMEGSPAIRAGITAGDVIVEVDGTDVVGRGMEYTRSLVLGQAGTEVKIGILRGGEKIYFTMKRAAVKQTTVSYYKIDDGIGYLGISQFASSTFADVKAALAEFDKEKINKIVIDLRDNPGGEKSAVINVMGLLMPTGKVLSIEYKDPLYNEEVSVENDSYGKYKTTLLVNRYSASASEVFAGTYKDRNMGTIIGETTFGKGTVQNTATLTTGGALKMTIATYKTGGGSKVNEIGVTPHRKIKNTICPLYKNTDIPQIEFARVIDENSSKQAVEAVEVRLSATGIYPGKIDGVFDKDTAEAVRIFQEKSGLPATGIMDVTTQVYLDNDTREMSSIIDNQYNEAVKILKEID